MEKAAYIASPFVVLVGQQMGNFGLQGLKSTPFITTRFKEEILFTIFFLFFFFVVVFFLNGVGLVT